MKVCGWFVTVVLHGGGLFLCGRDPNIKQKYTNYKFRDEKECLQGEKHQRSKFEKR